jgi:hypothetical protein
LDENEGFFYIRKANDTLYYFDCVSNSSLTKRTTATLFSSEVGLFFGLVDGKIPTYNINLLQGLCVVFFYWSKGDLRLRLTYR